MQAVWTHFKVEETEKERRARKLKKKKNFARDVLQQESTRFEKEK